MTRPGPAPEHTSQLTTYLADRSALIEAALDHLLPPADAFPAVLHRAMRYSVFAGGKRLRPLLVLAAAEAVGGSPEALLPLACAIELIQTYSLIHDDLPSMDDSDVRRGRPTCHVAFGEAVAVLAGDALHAQAFELIARTPAPVPAETVVAVTREIAAAIGTAGMVGGQVLDLLAEARPELPSLPDWPQQRDAAVRDIHIRKTAALIRASARSGAMLVGAPPRLITALTRYAERVGLAYQIIDDVLDEVGEAGKMGKQARRDAAKLTFPAVYGVQQSRATAASLTEEAVAELAPLGEASGVLRDLAWFLLEREA